MIGRTIGNYKILDKLGEGGMGSVFRARDEMLERDVAVKLLRPELAGQPDIVERFRSEAVTLARLQHPRIATLYSLAREGGELMMVMEFVSGDTLERILARAGGIAPGTAVHWACEVLDAMDYAHRKGVVHRDIKPANVMITDEGAVKVTDFGIARVLGGNRQTRTGHIIGTLAYMAPEQIRGEDVDGRTDLYALGILLFQLLTGRLPFEADTDFSLMMAQVNAAPPLARSLTDAVPDWLDHSIQRALAKAPIDRFQTAREFRADLERGVRGGSLPPDARVALVGPAPGADRPPAIVAPPAAPSMPSGALDETIVLHPAGPAASAPPAEPPRGAGQGVPAETSAKAQGEGGPEAPVARSAVPPATTPKPRGVPPASPISDSAPPVTPPAPVATPGAGVSLPAGGLPPLGAPASGGATAPAEPVSLPTPPAAGGEPDAILPVSLTAPAEDARSLAPAEVAPAPGSEEDQFVAAETDEMPRTSQWRDWRIYAALAVVALLLVAIVYVWFHFAPPTQAKPESALPSETTPAATPGDASSATPSVPAPATSAQGAVSGSTPSVGVPAPASERPAPDAIAPPAPPQASGAKPSPSSPAGGILLADVEAGRGRPSGQQPVTAVPAVVTPPAGNAAAPTATPVPSPTAAAVTGAPPAGRAQPSAAGAAGSAQPSAAGAAGSAQPSTAGAAAKPGGRPNASFTDVVWSYTDAGDQNEADVTLDFGPTEVVIKPDDEEIQGSTVAYSVVAAVSYTQNRPSKWKRLLFQRTSHWLTMKTRSGEVLLQLDSSNYKAIITELEARTGLTVAGKQ